MNNGWTDDYHDTLYQLVMFSLTPLSSLNVLLKIDRCACISTMHRYALLPLNSINPLIFDLCTCQFLALTFTCLFKEDLFITYYVPGKHSSEQNNMVPHPVEFKIIVETYTGSSNNLKY